MYIIYRSLTHNLLPPFKLPPRAQLAVRHETTRAVPTELNSSRWDGSTCQNMFWSGNYYTTELSNCSGHFVSNNKNLFVLTWELGASNNIDALKLVTVSDTKVLASLDIPCCHFIICHSQLAFYEWVFLEATFVVCLYIIGGILWRNINIQQWEKTVQPYRLQSHIQPLDLMIEHVGYDRWSNYCIIVLCQRTPCNPCCSYFSNSNTKLLRIYTSVKCMWNPGQNETSCLPDYMVS
jgi:hypothetical protein